MQVKLQLQAARDAADREACSRDGAGLAEHRHDFLSAEDTLRQNTADIMDA